MGGKARCLGSCEAVGEAAVLVPLPVLVPVPASLSVAMYLGNEETLTAQGTPVGLCLWGRGVVNPVGH